jgi:2,4-dienoyl-CoA reductase (NADPH2)
VARHLRIAAEIQLAAPQVAVVGAGYSWLRAFGPGVGAAMVASGRTAVIGLGRGALAYPDFAADIVRSGRFDPGQACTTCSLCSHLLRRQEPVGCVIRDPLYKGAARAARKGSPAP